ncbi:gamma-glutamyltransferase family protein [Saccharopolyspora sp. K220]|uniref:gamma-glutamyltransferase family protein n=1 Tax=Saccharopolyspora soli TaxID=2926618 RepID=UPI001F58DC34|nr:gamma-glutamyltransferase family protein [Saccharopolyspora soli]MCI2423022.1 gamma-glutamyltransferase family protein [Saccharopolyspora soli]
MFTTRPELVGDFGMVASTHWLASATGMSVLERGGNAADAAVAAGFVLQVVEPHLNGPGGEVPILLWSPADEQVRVVCGQGVAPAAASGARLAELGLDLVPGTGLLPTVVPGAFGAWLLLLRRWGTWTVRGVLEPAIHYAEHGHPLLGRVAEAIGTVAEMFSAEWPTSAQTWLPDGAVPTAGSRFRNPALASTYRRLVEEAEAAGAGREAQLEAATNAWYRGFVAEAIGSYCASAEVMDTSGRRHGGLLTADDLAGWQPGVEEPTTFDYHGHTICKTGPWGQGPVFLQQLALLAGYDLDEMGPGSADWVHTVIEAGKLAFADREAWYGDPNFTEVPVAELLSSQYNHERRQLIGESASLELRPGSPAGRAPVLPPYPDIPVTGAASGAGEPTVAATGETRGDTCHLDVADSSGMMISATPSGGWFQASPTIPGLGFCLSTRGQMFWVPEGLPNSLRPGARPRTTLTPSLALRDGRPWLAFGTPGGDFQDQWSLHVFLNVVHGRMNLQEAIDAPEFHSTHMPSSFYPRDAHPGELLLENRFDPAVVDELRKRGHVVRVEGDWALGRVSAVAREDGWLKAAANPRGSQGYAVGR